MKNNGMALGAVLAVFTGVGGFFIGQNNSSSAPPSDEESMNTKSSSASSLSSAKGGNERVGGYEPNLRGYELSKNPRASLELLLEELKQSPMAQMDFESLFSIWDMVQYLDADQLSQLVADLDGMGSGQEMMAVRMMLLNRWAAKDGPNAMKSILAQDKGMMRGIAAMGAVSGWMRAEPEQAYAWFKESGDELDLGGMGMSKEQVEGMYFAGLAKKDFEGAMARLDGMERKTKQAVIRQLASSAVGDPEQQSQLLDYLKEGGDESLLKETRSTIVTSLAWQDPEGALAFIDSENLDPNRKEELVSQTVNMWQHSDPQGAVEYLEGEYRGDENAGEKVSTAFGRWVGQNEVEAAEWLENQPENFKTDSVFRDAGGSLLEGNNYERASEWYGQILDDDVRATNYQQLHSRWEAEDPDAANQWVSGLPESEREQLLSPNVPAELIEETGLEFSP